MSVGNRTVESIAYKFVADLFLPLFIALGWALAILRIRNLNSVYYLELTFYTRLFRTSMLGI